MLNHDVGQPTNKPLHFSELARPLFLVTTPC